MSPNPFEGESVPPSVSGTGDSLEASPGEYQTGKRKPSELPEQYREQLLKLGKETGRSEEVVKSHYGRVAALVKFTAGRAGGSDSKGKRQQIADALLERTAPFFKSPEQLGRLEDALDAIRQIEAADNDEFVDTVSFQVVSALYGTMTQQEQERRSQEMMAEKFTPVNEILSYGKAWDRIHIHLAEARSRKPKEVAELLTSGMQDLAKVVASDEEIKQVTATSWIVAHRSGQKQLERLGFTIDGPIDEETRQKHFAGDDREIWASHIDREDFLKRYKERDGGMKVPGNFLI